MNQKLPFGIYTGETEEKYNDALDKFMRMHQENPLVNELISRTDERNATSYIVNQLCNA